MHNFQDRKMPVRDRALHEAAVRVALRLLQRDGLAGTTLTRIADRVELPGDERVSERTLRRRYGSATRLLFGSPWWLPDPYDAVRVVLAPRPDCTEGPVWPAGPEAEAAAAIDLDADEFDWPSAEFFTDAGIADPLASPELVSPQPITLRDLLHDLHVVVKGHLMASGYASQFPRIVRLRADEPEVAAWLAHAEAAWADRLAAALGPLFGLADPAAAVAAHAYAAAARTLDAAVGELGRADLALQRRLGDGATVRRAEAILNRDRLNAFDLFTDILSEPDRIRESFARGTVRSGGRYGMLRHRRPDQGTNR